jgi:hypothetical protein
MTQAERQELIEFGVLTPDCGPGINYWKLSPELKREARRGMNEREHMTGGLLLSRILERLTSLKREGQNEGKGKTTNNRTGNTKTA